MSEERSYKWASAIFGEGKDVVFVIMKPSSYFGYPPSFRTEVRYTGVRSGLERIYSSEAASTMAESVRSACNRGTYRGISEDEYNLGSRPAYIREWKQIANTHAETVHSDTESQGREAVPFGVFTCAEYDSVIKRLGEQAGKVPLEPEKWQPRIGSLITHTPGVGRTYEAYGGNATQRQLQTLGGFGEARIRPPSSSVITSFDTDEFARLDAVPEELTPVTRRRESKSGSGSRSSGSDHSRRSEGQRSHRSHRSSGSSGSSRRASGSGSASNAPSQSAQTYVPQSPSRPPSERLRQESHYGIDTTRSRQPPVPQGPGVARGPEGVTAMYGRDSMVSMVSQFTLDPATGAYYLPDVQAYAEDLQHEYREDRFNRYELEQQGGHARYRRGANEEYRDSRGGR